MSKKRTNRQRKAARSASKPTTPLNRIRGALGGREDWGILRSALADAKNDGPVQQFARLLRLASMSRVSDVAFPSTRAIKKPGRIQSVRPLDAATFLRELFWVKTVLKTHVRLLREFTTLRQKFIDSLLLSDFKSADDTLNAIDEQCGASLWSIENRIALKSLDAGFEPTKSYISELAKKNKRTFVAFFASSIGERNENRINRINYENRLKDRMRTWKIERGHEMYIFYRLLGKLPQSVAEAAEILAYEAASSPLDLYECYLDILACLPSLAPNFQPLESILADPLDVADWRYDLLTEVLLDKAPALSFKADYLEDYLSGDFVRAAESAQIALRLCLSDPTPVLVLSKIAARGINVESTGSTFLDKIIASLRDYLSLAPQQDDAANYLDRIALNFQSIPLARCIEKILAETSTDYIGDIPFKIASRLSAQCHYPALMLRSESRRVEWAQQTPPTALGQYLQIAHIGKPFSGKLGGDALAFASLSHARGNDNYDAAIKEIERLENSLYAYVRQDARVLKTWILNFSGDLTAAVQSAVGLAVENSSLLRVLPIESIFRPRGFRDLKFLEDDISLAIGFYLYSSLTRENSKDVALKVAWKQFHKAHRISVPSELVGIKENFPRDELNYFLRHVCTQEIMELSSAFNSPADLDKERLKICIALSEHDQELSPVYNSEIIEITRRLSIEDGVQQIENSRVYVDLLGLQRWSHNNLNETYLRYQDYSAAGFGASNEELEKSLLALLKKSGFDVEVVNFLDGYDISSDSLLAEIIESIATSFLTLPRFGLDAFLGSRVRHGSLEGAFRSRLEERRLITKIDSRSNQYETNRYWLDGVAFKNKEQKANVDRTLATFSKNIDAIIDAAITRFVYVNSSSNTEGLITLWPGDERQRRNLLKSWIAAAKMHLTPTTSIEQLTEFCATTMFWPALKQSLSAAANYVGKALLAELQEELNKLSVSVLSQTDQLPMLITTIEVAKTDLANAAAKVAKWFAPPQYSVGNSTYLLKTGIEIGIQSIQHRHPGFTPHISWSVEADANVLLNPRAFEVVNDVSFLIFGNIRQHAGYAYDIRGHQGESAVKIAIKSRDKAFVDVEVQNSISANADLSQIKEGISKARDIIDRGELDAGTSKRKNTGLVRLASTLNYEQSADKQVEFGVTDDRHFRVYFSVPVVFLTGIQQ
ncbi:hypothetical protein [Variovorax boronicumulans]